MKVLVIRDVDGDNVNVFGEGLMIGEVVPDYFPFSSNSIPNPCMLMDDGSYIFGLSSWWGDLEKAKAKYDGFNFKNVPDEVGLNPVYVNNFKLDESKVTGSPLLDQITLRQIKTEQTLRELCDLFILELKFSEEIEHARLVMVDECICRIDYKTNGFNYSAFCKELKFHKFLELSNWDSHKTFVAKRTHIYKFRIGN